MMLLSKNFDHTEIEKFSDLKNVWWQKDGPFKMLHRLNPLRLNYIQQYSGDLAAKQVLDVGCGGGILTETLMKTGAFVTGIDMAEPVLEVAMEHAKEEQLPIHYQAITVEELAEQLPNHYDVITCMELLEHIPHPASVIKACSRLLKPGGHLFLSTINRNSFSWLIMIAGAEYLTHSVPLGTHHVEKFIRPSELIYWLNNSGLKEQHISGFRYQPLCKNFTLTPSVAVNYILHAQLPKDDQP